MRRTGKFKSPKQMIDEWEKYKDNCNNRITTIYEFSSRKSEFVKTEIVKKVTYTIKGFALWCGMTEQNFYATYAHNSKFESVIACMKEECEIDAREKFELGMIDSRLAGLWMSNYGYTTKTDQNILSKNSVVVIDDCNQ